MKEEEEAEAELVNSHDSSSMLYCAGCVLCRWRFSFSVSDLVPGLLALRQRVQQWHQRREIW